MKLTDIPQKPGIYKITNQLNGKIYIGKSVNLYERLRHHIKGLGSQYITYAIIKYKWDNFILEILEQFDYLDNWELLALETAYIEYFESLTTQNGYNICNFSNDATGRRHSEETKKKMSISGGKHLIGKTFTEEHRKNLSLSRTGKKRNPDSIQKISKRVQQIDPKTNEVIKIWKSIAEAGRSFGGENKRHGITAVCNQRVNRKSGIQQTAHGFKWKYN